MKQLNKTLPLLAILLAVLTACSKKNPEQNFQNATISIKVTGKEGNTLSNIAIGVFPANSFEKFKKDPTLPAYKYITTDRQGEARIVLEAKEWFETNSYTEVYFVVLNYVNAENYRYWSSGGTVQNGENKTYHIRTELTSSDSDNLSDFKIKDGILLQYTGQTSKEIKLPAGIRGIAPYCFAQSAIQNVVLNDDLEFIGEGAFFKSAVTQIQFPASLKEIGSHAFEDCDKLEKADLSRSQLTEIAESSFWGSGIKTIDLPDRLTHIGSQAFLQTTRLQTITLPTTVVYIGNEAFRESGIRTIQLSNAIQLLGERAFYQCRQLKQVTCQGSESDRKGIMEYSCFDACEALQQLEIPSNLCDIQGWAFTECTSLRQLTIPEHVTHIGPSCFTSSPVSNITFRCQNPPAFESRSLPSPDQIQEIRVPETSVKLYQEALPSYSSKIKENL